MTGRRFSLVLVVVTFPGVPGFRAESESTLRVEEGVVYSQPDGLDLALNFALPTTGRGPFPVILCIHGGGWKAGNRENYNGLIRQLAGTGYAAFSASYRLTTTHAWPAQIQDVRAALGWIRSEAQRLNLDIDRVGVMGHSAGGHLSLMLGLLPDVTRGDHRPIEAVVNFFGPTDMTAAGIYRPDIDTLIVELAGGRSREESPEVYRSFSPVTHISRGDPPILTFHGDADVVVPVGQARVLQEALEKTGAGVIHRLEIIEAKGHGWGGEDREATDRATVEFFDAYLRGDGLPLLLAENFDAGAAAWEPADAAQWKLGGAGGQTYYAMVTEKNAYSPSVRSPRNFALLKGFDVEDFVLDVSLQYTHHDYDHASLCLFFGYQDPSHFYYVHFGKKADDHANSIFLVDGKPRVSIAKKRTEGTDWDRSWHRARVRREVESGRIEIYFDDMENPVMTAEDATFGWGRVGIGSFDDKGNFDTIRLYGVRR